MGKRRDVLKLAGLPFATLFAQDLAPVTNGTRDPEQARLGKTPVGDARTYYYGPTQQLKNLRVGNWQIAPGKSPHNIHQHPDEELLIITEGTGTATVAGKTSKVGPGSILYCEGNVPHGVLNTGDTPMFLLLHPLDCLGLCKSANAVALTTFFLRRLFAKFLFGCKISLRAVITGFALGCAFQLLGYNV